MRDLPEIKLSRLPDEKFRHSTLWICLWPILHFPGHNVLFVLNMVYSCVSRVAMMVYVRCAAPPAKPLCPDRSGMGSNPSTPSVVRVGSNHRLNHQSPVLVYKHALGDVCRAASGHICVLVAGTLHYGKEVGREEAWGGDTGMA